MEDLKNSELLDLLIDYAKNYGGGAPRLTAERFMIAVCDYIDGLVPGDTGGQADRINLKSALESAGTTPEAMKKAMQDHLAVSAAGSASDGVYFQKALFDAKSAARKMSSAVLRPDDLLRCILKDPSEAIRKGMGASSQRSGTSADEFLRQIREGLPGFGAEPDPEKPEEEPEKTGGQEPSGASPSGIGDAKDSREAIDRLTENVKSIREHLLSRVFGQDNAVSVVCSGLFQAELLDMTDRSRERPRATFLFAGPPGVGKTFLAETLAKRLGLPFMPFDMSEYSDDEATVEFCGSDSVYRNAKEGNVTKFVRENPKCVVLFDEIEKAHLSVIHLFLQLLDKGRVHDVFKDCEVSFADAIVILTTNAGKQLYEESETGDFSGLPRKVILKALERDVNPQTGEPFFPAAICSRFASGNVVMFNRMAAYDLLNISRSEISRHQENFKKRIGITAELDELVYPSLLFAEGGAADGRTIRARSEAFFNNELFELFRLISSDGKETGKLEKIRFRVELPEKAPEILSLYEGKETPEVLIFASAETVEKCAKYAGNCRVCGAQTGEEAKKILNKRDLRTVLIDYRFGIRSGSEQLLNAEDVDSAGRDFFWMVREKYRDLTVYLLQTSAKSFSAEEEVSFKGLGVRGLLNVSSDMKTFTEELSLLCTKLHHQNSMDRLAKANKLVTYETKQQISPDGKTAEITLFDLEMATAVDAEDSKNILSGISRPDTTFEEVIGAENAKDALRDFVDYLHNPKRYAEIGGRPPRGVLLYGPPGTGKTMLAKALAHEADVTFISTTGSQFLSKWVGEGNEKVKQLFRIARKYAPAVLFIDEIDAVAKERKGGEHASANGEDVLTTLLAQMDGFRSESKKPVFVMAATNFDVKPGTPKSLDAALLRRFDHQIYVDLPNHEERVRLLHEKKKGRKAFDTLTDDAIENIATRSSGMSPADLETVLENALQNAIRSNGGKVTDAILEESFESKTGGERKNWDAAQQVRVARHEAGHTYLCWKGGETPSYVTIVSRGDYGGYMQHAENEGKMIETREELNNRIRTSLGGRAAEIVYYGEKDGISTGASGDLSTATAIARRLICSFGMDSRFGLAVIDDESARYGELSVQVRAAVNAILAEKMDEAIKAIGAGRKAVDALVEALMQKDHLSGPEIDAILRANS